MDIRNNLATDRSRQSITRICQYVGSDPKRFRELTEVLFEGEDPLPQRASWAMSDVALQHPDLILPYTGRILTLLTKRGLHQGVIRSLLRAYLKADIPEKYCAPFFDLCMIYLQDETADVAVRANALTIACNIAVKYPELKQELSPVAEQLSLMPQKPAMRVRLRDARKTLR